MENVSIGSNSVLLLDAVLVVGFDRVVVWVPAGECGNGRGVGDGAARIHCNVKLYYYRDTKNLWKTRVATSCTFCTSLDCLCTRLSFFNHCTCCSSAKTQSTSSVRSHGRNDILSLVDEKVEMWRGCSTYATPPACVGHPAHSKHIKSMWELFNWPYRF